MKEKEKDLLLQDLCARLNCGVKAHYKYYDFIGGTEQLVSEDDAIITGINTTLGNPIQVDGYYVEVEYVKPYLRPMSSMTEEETVQYSKLCYKETRTESVLGYLASNDYYHDTVESIDWLNKKGFDYRGLIEKGLALEAPEGMYKI